MKNVKISKLPKRLEISLYFASFIFLILKKNSKLSLNLANKSEIVMESYYVNVRDLLICLVKHTPLRFNKLSDIVVYDRSEYKLRFILSYILTNSDREGKVRIRISIKSKYTIIPSVSRIIYTANWAERESMDMFGIKFIGHFDLRRILGDYGLWGFVGRKDFPLMGIITYMFAINFSRVFCIRGVLNDYWTGVYQKLILIEKC